ncbi:hypothetical protein M0R45_017913 [Rubus argutus]|uniref:Uncharacterized protein n=1 Tax=Rubus argutus TaxID=59490 RepID=A0AAW1XXA8_RUBAR
MAITTKIDVYSFGVVLLEIICCRRCVDLENNCDERVILTVWVCDCYREGVLNAVVDYEGEALNDRSKLERLVMVALWCIQEDPSLRPTMTKVVQMVEGVVHVPPCHCHLQEQVETNFVLYCDHLKTRWDMQWLSDRDQLYILQDGSSYSSNKMEMLCLNLPSMSANQPYYQTTVPI